MLVLSRQVGEAVKISNLGLRIEVVVASTRGKRVSLSVEAPRGVAISRGEIAPFFAPSTNRPGGRLILSRKVREKLLLFLPDGSVGEIVVVRLGGSLIRLGFDFPKEYQIRRDELEEVTP